RDYSTVQWRAGLEISPQVKTRPVFVADRVRIETITRLNKVTYWTTTGERRAVLPNPPPVCRVRTPPVRKTSLLYLLLIFIKYFSHSFVYISKWMRRWEDSGRWRSRTSGSLRRSCGSNPGFATSYGDAWPIART